MMALTVRVPYPDVDLTSHSPPIMRFWDHSTLEGQSPFIEPTATFYPTRECALTRCTLVIEGGEYDLTEFSDVIRLRSGDTLVVWIDIERV